MPAIYKRLLKGSLLLSAVLALVAFFQNCGGGFKVNPSLSSKTLSSVVPDAPRAESGVTFAQPDPQVVNLGKQIHFVGTVNSDSNYSGLLTFSFRKAELAAIDPGQSIQITFDQDHLPLSRYSSANFGVTVKVPSMSPSFSPQDLHLDAMDLDSGAVVATTTVSLEVKAIYDVVLHGPATAPEDWGIAPGASVGFIPHAEGLTVRFINQHTVSHEVHSSGGPIPHEPGPLAAGQMYVVTVPPATVSSSSIVYCHDHETSAQGRTLQFNVQASAPPPPNPNAKFSYINTTVLQPKCVSCHNDSVVLGGVKLNSYANVLNSLAAGNASLSPLYTSVAPGGNMPPSGGSLSSDLVTDIKDWINAGAPNN